MHCSVASERGCKRTYALEKANFNQDFSVCSDISEAETLEMALINAVWCLVSNIMFILECLEWNSGLHLQYADSGE